MLVLLGLAGLIFTPVGGCLVLLAAAMLALHRLRSKPIAMNTEETFGLALRENSVALTENIRVVRDSTRDALKEQLAKIQQSSHFDDLFSAAVVDTFIAGNKHGSSWTNDAGEYYLRLLWFFHRDAVSGLLPADGVELLRSTDAKRGSSESFAAKLLLQAALQADVQHGGAVTNALLGMLLAIYQCALLTSARNPDERQREAAQYRHRNDLLIESLRAAPAWV